MYFYVFCPYSTKKYQFKAFKKKMDKWSLVQDEGCTFDQRVLFLRPQFFEWENKALCSLIINIYLQVYILSPIDSAIKEKNTLVV